MRWKDWKDIKLYSDNQLKSGDIDVIAASGTDAMILSGSLNVSPLTHMIEQSDRIFLID